MEITFSGQYTKEELLQAQKLHTMPSPPMLIFRIGATAAAIIFYIAHLFLSPSDSLMEEIGILLPVGIIVLLMMRPFLEPYETINKIMKDPDFTSALSGKVGEAGVTLVARRSTSELKWGLFKRTKQKGDLLLLYQDNNWYTLFPRRFFSTDADWSGFQELVKKNISR